MNSAISDVVAATQDYIDATDREIAGIKDSLSDLRSQRNKVAVDGGETHALRDAIAEFEAQLDDLSIRRHHLVEKLEGFGERQKRREQLAELRAIYNADLQFLYARREVLCKQAEVRSALAALQRAIDERDLERSGHINGMTAREYPLRMRERPELDIGYGSRFSIQLAPLSGTKSDGGETIGELDVEISRIANLLTETATND